MARGNRNQARLTLHGLPGADCPPSGPKIGRTGIRTLRCLYFPLRLPDQLVKAAKSTWPCATAATAFIPQQRYITARVEDGDALLNLAQTASIDLCFVAFHSLGVRRLLAAKWSRMKTRTTDDRFAFRRSVLMLVIKSCKVVWRSLTISLSASQNPSSRRMLVLLPPTVIDRFGALVLTGFEDFMVCSPERGFVARFCCRPGRVLGKSGFCDLSG